jgi:phosphoribosylcarboxyaminoimidazole (NCAIR) mutase
MERASLRLASRSGRALAFAALALALPAGGCATSVADLPVVGVPADAPARPKEAGAYPAVHDMPQDRPEAAMDAAERNKLSNELIAARDRQASSAAAAKNPVGQ